MTPLAANKVVIDTSAFFALISNKDEFHEAAKFRFAQLLDDEAELYTSSYVLVETTALVMRRVGFEPIRSFLEPIRDGLRVIWVTGEAHWQAWGLLEQKSGRGISFVDCTMVILAKSLDAQVFTFDSGFAREGLLTIPR